jgi:hypothetical protein
MEMVLKTIVPATVPWVRIPPLPPVTAVQYNSASIIAAIKVLNQSGEVAV